MVSAAGPYTPVRQAGDYYFVSGQIGMDQATRHAEEDISSQTRQALRNLAALLAEHHLTAAEVVKTTVFLTDMTHFAAVNDEYQEFFPEPRPARSCVAVAELPRVADSPLLVEIEAVIFKAGAQDNA
jgi:2-iminobutanoate/2-iminopropanoate deaminase